MSNWFENNPTKSIFSYTLILLATAFAASYFLFATNRDDNHRLEKEQLETRILSLKEKNDMYEFEIKSLTEERNNLIEWIQSIPGSVMYFDKKIKEIENRVVIDTIKIDVINKNNAISQEKYIFESKSTSKGNSVIDARTNATIGLNEITVNRTASGVLNLPNQKSKRIANVIAGEKWDFEHNGQKFELTIMEINFMHDTYKILIKQI
jgi:hypothetical protein